MPVCTRSALQHLTFVVPGLHLPVFKAICAKAVVFESLFPAAGQVFVPATESGAVARRVLQPGVLRELERLASALGSARADPRRNEARRPRTKGQVNAESSVPWSDGSQTDPPLCGFRSQRRGAVGLGTSV